MSTIEMILEVNPDGTIHIPLPPELRGKRIEVTATLCKVNGDSTATKSISKTVRRRREFLKQLRRGGAM